MRTGKRGIAVAAALLGGTLAGWADGAAAQEPLFQPPVVVVGIQPDFVVAGDVNGDGRTDLVAALTSNAYVVALRQQVGGWTAGTPVPTGGSLGHLALGDLDADGRLDLVYAVDLPGHDELHVRFGDGLGTFGAPVKHFTALGPFDVDLSDLDGDGDLDAAVSCGAGDSVSILRNPGDGSLLPKQDYAAGDEPLNTAVGDWNGDGAPDLACANYAVAAANQAVTVLLNAGDGTFGAPATVPQPQRPHDIEAGDFDGDGELDLAYTQGIFSSVALLHGNGDGSFDPPVSLFVTTGARVLAVADLDENGRADLVTPADKWWGFLVASVLSRASGFDPTGYHGVYGNSKEVLAHDVTDDGDIDLVVCCGMNPTDTGRFLSVLEGRGDGSFGPSAGVAGQDTPDFAFGDLDEDGRADLVTASEDSVLSVIAGTGLGAFARATPLLSPGAPDSPRSIALADLDGDGHLDLAAAVQNPAQDRIDLWFGNGSLVPDAPVSFPVSAPLDALAAADLDADDDADLLYLSNPDTAHAELHIRLNDGTGSFGAPMASLAAKGWLLAVDELTGDRVPDVIVICNPGNEPKLIQVYPGNGDGSVGTPLVSLAGGGGFLGIDTGDADGDGDTDVLLAESGGFFVHLCLNTGAGTFPDPVKLQMGTGANPVGAALVDVDRDGLLDVAAACSLTLPANGMGELALRRGLGGGTYAGAQSYGLPLDALALQAHDVDGDGWLDLAVADEREGVTVLLNQRGPWNALGHPLAGSFGLPRLVGEGSLVPGEPFRIALTDSLRSSPVGLVLGTSQADLPFKGGVLVPLPLVILQPLVTDAAGDLVLEGSWPSGAGGLTLVLQFWLQDPAGIAGYAASNGLAADVP
jgi:hypothetical protein